MLKNLCGSYVALVTPMNQDGSINYDKIGELVDYHIQNKTDGLVILATTGESPTLSFEEEELIAEYVIKRVNKRIPVIIGSGSNETEKAKNRSILFEKMGADALLVITPYYNRTNNKGMIKHFFEVADNVNIPIILYNVPGRTGCSISIDVLEILSKHKNIIGIKEASGSIAYVAKVAKLCNENFTLLSGEDGMLVPMMSLGAKGVISVWANICPSVVKNVCDLCLNNEYDKARKLQLKHLELINNLFIETNPIPIKEAMNYLEFNVGPTRLPLYEMDEDNRNKLIKSLDEMSEDICKLH